MKARMRLKIYFAVGLVLALPWHVSPAVAQSPFPPGGIRLTEEQAEALRKVCDEAMKNMKVEESRPPAAPLPYPKGTMIVIKTGPEGVLQRDEYGNSREMKMDGTTIETNPEGLKIETLPSGTKIVSWPKGGGFMRYPDGKGAEIKPDGEMVNALGTIEILENGVVLQKLEDEGVVLERRPDGSVASKKDQPAAKPENRASGAPVSGVPPSELPGRQVAMESVMIESARSCHEDLLGVVLRADAQTAGVPKPSAEIAQVQESKPGLFESLVPILIPSIGIGGGRGREEPERRFPDRR